MWNIVSKNALVLAGFALVCLSAVILVNLLTKDKIALEQQKAEYKNLTEIFDDVDIRSNQTAISCYQVSNHEWLGTAAKQKVYIIYSDNQHVGTFINTVAPDGYNGSIQLNIGLDSHNNIQGVRVASHKETPGLGDKIELAKSNWLLSFNSLSATSETNWNVTKQGGDFDAFAGATITPQAVIKAVHRTLQNFPNIDALQSSYNNCESSHESTETT